MFIVGFVYYFRSHLGHHLLRYNIYCISIVNTNQAQLMIVYKASNMYSTDFCQCYHLTSNCIFITIDFGCYTALGIGSKCIVCSYGSAKYRGKWMLKIGNLRMDRHMLYTCANDGSGETNVSHDSAMAWSP